MCGFPQIWRVLDPLVGEKNCRAGWRVLTLVCGFSLSQLLLSKNWLFLEKSPIIFKKNFDGMNFFQKLWHKNGIKKLPRAFFECAGFEQIGVRENVRVFGKSAKIWRVLRKKLWQHCNHRTPTPFKVWKNLIVQFWKNFNPV